MGIASQSGERSTRARWMSPVAMAAKASHAREAPGWASGVRLRFRSWPACAEPPASSTAAVAKCTTLSAR